MPHPSIFLTGQWRHLVMLNYLVDPAILLPLVPKGTELDAWNGRIYISMVGFLFLETKVMGLPIPFHRNFEEVNLRFYVRRVVGGEVRRGVVFIKEIVPRWAIATAARLFYNERYVAMPMRNRLQMNGAMVAINGSVEYGWKPNEHWNSIAVQTSGPPQPIADGSEEEFITEHYWGYARQRDGGTAEYQVEHPRWMVRACPSSQLVCDAEQLYGAQLAQAVSGPPCSAFMAEGSEIIVRTGVRIA
ncbi:MAG: DUF2071 domain-containing protein [Armatimonadetes bacterium]|nr:DUF2071 domain-containing protein [Armatimonadota bacterium]